MKMHRYSLVIIEFNFRNSLSNAPWDHLHWKDVSDSQRLSPHYNQGMEIETWAIDADLASEAHVVENE